MWLTLNRENLSELNGNFKLRIKCFNCLYLFMDLHLITIYYTKRQRTNVSSILGKINVQLMDGIYSLVIRNYIGLYAIPMRLDIYV